MTVRKAKGALQCGSQAGVSVGLRTLSDEEYGLYSFSVMAMVLSMKSRDYTADHIKDGHQESLTG